jgi:hypothetical protein
MTTLPGMPVGDPVEDASIDTTGEAFLIPTALNSGEGAVVTQIKIYCSAKCYVSFNNDATPAAVADRDRAVQQAATEEVYVRAARRGQSLPYVVVAAASGTVAADISYFG